MDFNMLDLMFCNASGSLLLEKRDNVKLDYVQINFALYNIFLCSFERIFENS